MDWQEELISLYLYVCKEFERKLNNYCQRMSNHADLSFSDEEVITIYLFGVMRHYRSLKTIHEYASDHLRAWFPKLPVSYEAFVMRINRVSDVFVPPSEELLSQGELKKAGKLLDVMDQCPLYWRSEAGVLEQK